MIQGGYTVPSNTPVLHHWEGSGRALQERERQQLEVRPSGGGATLHQHCIRGQTIRAGATLHQGPSMFWAPHQRTDRGNTASEDRPSGQGQHGIRGQTFRAGATRHQRTDLQGRGNTASEDRPSGQGQHGIRGRAGAPQHQRNTASGGREALLQRTDHYGEGQHSARGLAVMHHG
jgi:hypothetical protein